MTRGILMLKKMVYYFINISLKKYAADYLGAVLVLLAYERSCEAVILHYNKYKGFLSGCFVILIGNCFIC